MITKDWDGRLRWVGEHAVETKTMDIGEAVDLNRAPTLQALANSNPDRLDNPHPADILIHDFGLVDADVDDVAAAARIDPAKLRAIVLDKAPVDAETSLLLAKHFGLSDGYFLRLQASYDAEERASPTEIDAEAPKKLGEAESRLAAVTATNAFLVAHTQRLIDRLAGARMMAGDMSIEAATQFVNAERGAVKSVLERVG